MTLKALNAIEPTQLLQTILAKEAEISRGKYQYTGIQKSLKGVLLTSAFIVGVGACASEILSLIPDGVCKLGQSAIL